MRTGRPTKPNDKPSSVTVLPHVRMTCGHSSRSLAEHIKSIGMLPRKISYFLRPAKDDMELKTPGVYSIPYKCGQVYIRQTGWLHLKQIKGVPLAHPACTARRIGGGRTYIQSVLPHKTPRHQNPLPNQTIWTDLSGKQLCCSFTQTV